MCADLLVFITDTRWQYIDINSVCIQCCSIHPAFKFALRSLRLRLQTARRPGGCQKGKGRRRSDLSQKCRGLDLSRWVFHDLVASPDFRDEWQGGFPEISWTKKMMICHDLLLVSMVYYWYLLGLCHSVEPDKDFRRAQLEAEQQLALATRQAEVEQGIRSGIRIASKRN